MTALYWRVDGDVSKLDTPSAVIPLLVLLSFVLAALFSLSLPVNKLINLCFDSYIYIWIGWIFKNFEFHRECVTRPCPEWIFPYGQVIF